MCRITTTIRLICAFCAHSSHICGKFDAVRKKHPAFDSSVSILNILSFQCFSAFLVAVCCRCMMYAYMHAFIRWLRPTELTLDSIKEIEKQNNCNEKYIRCSNKTSANFICIFILWFRCYFSCPCISQDTKDCKWKAFIKMRRTNSVSSIKSTFQISKTLLKLCNWKLCSLFSTLNS